MTKSNENPEADLYPKIYNCCPVCRSKLRFFEELSAEAKVNGAALANFQMSLNVAEGACADKRIANNLKPGTPVATFMVKTDVCLNCGCVYAVFVNKRVAKVSLPTATKLPSKLDLSGLPMNNPRAS